jgi:ribosomal-protein-serine acetyltransferase
MNIDYRSLILIAGEKLRLVPFDVSFAETLFEAIEESKPALEEWSAWYRTSYTFDDCRNWLESREQARFEKRAFDFAITDATTGDFVGSCGLHHIRARRGELSFWIRTSRQNEDGSPAVRALADFGLSRLGLVRIEIVIAERNFADQSVVEKIGATREARLRNRLIIQDEIHHAYLFALLGSGERPEEKQDPRWVKFTM